MKDLPKPTPQEFLECLNIMRSGTDISEPAMELELYFHLKEYDGEELANDREFRKTRVRNAYGAYAAGIYEGKSEYEARQMARDVLFANLEYSRYYVLVHGVINGPQWCNLMDRIPKGFTVEAFAGILLQNEMIMDAFAAFERFRLNPNERFCEMPDYEYHAEYDQFCKRLSQAIITIINENDWEGLMRYPKKALGPRGERMEWFEADAIPSDEEQALLNRMPWEE